ncbi:MAG: hypothetical protein HYT87_16785 [Nitrospirae bacterium]|nr:hypothetical protein [Nitrospirota bacterium]
MVMSSIVASCGVDPIASSNEHLALLDPQATLQADSVDSELAIGKAIYRASSRVGAYEGFESFADGFSFPPGYSSNGLAYYANATANRVTAQNPIAGTRSLQFSSILNEGLFILVENTQDFGTVTGGYVRYAFAVDSGVTQVDLGGYNLSLIVNTTGQVVPWSSVLGVEVPAHSLILRDGNLDVLLSEPYVTGSIVSVEAVPVLADGSGGTLTVNGNVLQGLGSNPYQIGTFSTVPVSGFTGTTLRIDEIEVLIQADTIKQKKDKKDKKDKKK